MKPREFWIQKTYQGHGDVFGSARTESFKDILPDEIHVREVVPINWDAVIEDFNNWSEGVVCLDNKDIGYLKQLVEKQLTEKEE